MVTTPYPRKGPEQPNWRDLRSGAWLLEPDQRSTFYRLLPEFGYAVAMRAASDPAFARALYAPEPNVRLGPSDAERDKQGLQAGKRGFQKWLPDEDEPVPERPVSAREGREAFLADRGLEGKDKPRAGWRTRRAERLREAGK